MHQLRHPQFCEPQNYIYLQEQQYKTSSFLLTTGHKISATFEWNCSIWITQVIAINCMRPRTQIWCVRYGSWRCLLCRCTRTQAPLIGRSTLTHGDAIITQSDSCFVRRHWQYWHTISHTLYPRLIIHRARCSGCVSLSLSDSLDVWERENCLSGAKQRETMDQRRIINWPSADNERLWLRGQKFGNTCVCVSEGGER